MTVRMLTVGLAVVFSAVVCVTATPTLVDGVDLLLMLCDPYGANSGLLWNNVERLGWNVTVTGTNATVASCSHLTTPIVVHRTIAEIVDPAAFDVVIVSPTPGTFNTNVDPAAELRSNPQALDLLRQADACGATLYGGCSAYAVLGDAGVLEGHDVLYHSALGAAQCKAYGASSWSRGGPGTPPRVSGNVVTATNQRYFALEIPEALARSLDRFDTFAPSLDLIVSSETSLTGTTMAPSGAVRAAAAWGTPGSEAALDVCAVSGGYVVVGFTYAAGEGNADVLVIRLDAAGRLLWARTVGGPGRDIAYGVTATDDGFAVCGLTTSAGAGGEDALLFEMDGDGNLLWRRTFGHSGHDAAFDLTATRDGGLVFVGMSDSKETQDTAFWVVVTDRDGNERWTATMDGRLYERALAVIERRDGGFLVAGGTTSMGAGNYDMLLVAYNAAGDELWSQTYGRAQFNLAEAVLERADGTLAVLGYGDQESRDPNNMELVFAGTDGRMTSRKTTGPQRSFDYGQDLVELPDGGLLVCGASNYGGTGHNDAWFVKFDEAGEIRWEQSYGLDTGNEWLNALCQGSDGDIASVGWTRAIGQGSHDVLFVIVDPAGSP